MAALQKSPRRGGAAQRQGRPVSRYLSPWPKAETIWCNTGTQDWTIRDAARERLVLTKTDEEPTSFTSVRTEADLIGETSA